MLPGYAIILSMWIPATIIVISLIKWLSKEEARLERRNKKTSKELTDSKEA